MSMKKALKKMNRRVTKVLECTSDSLMDATSTVTDLTVGLASVAITANIAAKTAVATTLILGGDRFMNWLRDEADWC